MAGKLKLHPTPQVAGGKGGTDYFDTILPGGGQDKNTIDWQRGLRRAFLRGRSYFQHYLTRAGVEPQMIQQYTSDLYTGKISDRKGFRGMAQYGGYHGHKARYDAAMKQKGAVPGTTEPTKTLLSPRSPSFGNTRPSPHAWNRIGPGGPAYRAGSWDDTQRIEYDQQNMGGYGPGGMIQPNLGMGGYGPNFGPHGKLNPNIGRRIGDTHYSPQHMGGYGPGGMTNPNAPPGHIRGSRRRQ